MIQPQNKMNNPDTVFISCNFTANTGTIVDVRLNKVLPEKYVEACLLVLVKLFLRQKRAFLFHCRTLRNSRTTCMNSCLLTEVLFMFVIKCLYDKKVSV